MSKMTKEEVRKIATNKGIILSHDVNIAKPIIERRNKTKEQLIREIQSADGYNACFKTEVVSCQHSNCSWYSECQK